MSGIGHFLVSPNSFLRHQVRISTAETCWSVFIVNIHHQVMLGTFLHCIMKPCTPHLIADLYKTEFNTFYTPTLV